MNNFIKKLYAFTSSWTGTIIIVLFLNFFVIQSFVIPSGSMKRTELIGDFLFVKKFSYGIPIPHLPWLEIPILPDFNKNGHLIEGSRPKREDIVVFRYPKNKKIHYVKRCVAVGGDEILYANKKLLIHFHEGDDYIRKYYSTKKIKKLQDKLWVENPYMEKYPGIQYAPEGMNIFEALLNYYVYHEKIDVRPVMVDGFDVPTYKLKNRTINAFYAKVPKDHFYMIGDNRDNSNDSRFWGPVPYSFVVGTPWCIWTSIEYRSYDAVLNGDKFGSGQDHAGLKRICGDTPIDSEACEKLWNRQRYTVRWGRVGRRIKTLEREQPIQ
ncbi:MAG: signal peptidase I [Sulfurovum sp.]|nr:signal peptidase I [Sulfurovum sp.]MCB4759912.1 signal peptidase I [Sulfurovum sp.]